MDILKLIMGRDEDCLLCRHPRAGCIPPNVPFPWLLCPTHYGKLTDDPEIMALVEKAKDLPSL